MKALVITTEYPFPARNGVTIPVANYIRLLKEMGWAVDLVMVGARQDGSAESKPLRSLYLEKKRNTVIAVLKELLLVSPFSCNFTVSPTNWKERFLTEQYELVLSSPISMVGIGRDVKEYLSGRFGKPPKWIAAISDCYTAELHKAVSGMTILGVDLPSVNRLRSLYMKRIEKTLLSTPDEVFVQSEKDKLWLNRIGVGTVEDQVKIVTNGVDEGLFDLPILAGGPARKFCFVADLRSNDYRKKLIWLYRNVWVNLDIPEKELFVIGRGLQRGDTGFQDLFEDETVRILDRFYETVPEIYAGMDVLFAPIFKNHGFINKVGEAMAAGVVVIGDESAFNAIEGFQAGVHGLSANSGEEMEASAKRLFEDGELFAALKMNGRVLAERVLRWEGKKAAFGSALPK